MRAKAPERGTLWAQRAAALTEGEIEAAIADDLDEAEKAVDWSQASVELTAAQGQTKINAILRSYVEQMLP